MTLVLPLPDNKANDRAHWRSVLKGKHALWKAADATENPHPPLHPFQRVALAYEVRHGGCAMDWDNLTARLKHAQDWLVNAGYLADDSPKVIPAQPTLTQRAHTKKGERCVVVTIQPMGE